MKFSSFIDSRSKLTYFVLHAMDFFKLVFKHFFYFLNLSLQLIELAISISFILHSKCRYEINNSSFVFNRMDPPIVNYKF